MKRILTFMFAMGIFTVSFAQTKDQFSNYNMMSFSYKHDKQWSAYLELQLRSIEDFTTPDYYEAKGGIGYNFNKNNQAFVGIGRYGTYKNEHINQEEFRFWLQYIYSQQFGKVKLDHRVRAEKRFFYYPNTDSHDNTERYRYRLAATLPLNKDKVEPGALYANAFEEVFVGPKDPFFKRSRTFVGLGYQFNPYVGTNLGYIFQKEFSNSGNKNLHFIYLSLNFTFDRLKFNETHHIPVAD
ncbi:MULTISPECIES: DUF2490 domain-containing protein [Amniculibacterium]|uniref:DUF2490 domain-containing protein n=1 Tax=Amniculibacterium TaxID=2715289 RepID=UPI000F5A3B2D|nr:MULTISPECIES: DUF2490 domain-containing protein [Amniculibacterium]